MSQLRVSFRDLGPPVKLLLTMGTEPLIASPCNEWSPLASAIESQCLEAISLILDAGADPSIKQRKIGPIAVLIESLSIRRNNWPVVSSQVLVSP